MPPGWRVGESGPYALTLLSPDNRAMTVMVGVAGSPLNYPPARFAYEKLSTMQLQNLQLGEARQARPAAGFRQAFEFDVGYSQRGVAYRRVAKVSVALAYDAARLAMTAGLAPSDQWAGYANWLPQVADQVSALNGAAFGAASSAQTTPASNPAKVGVATGGKWSAWFARTLKSACSPRLQCINSYLLYSNHFFGKARA